MVMKKADTTGRDKKERALGQLRGPLKVTHAGRRMFPLGPATQDEVITTSRFILILRGSLDYTSEGRTARLHAGTQFLVPAWVRRVWSVPRGGPCEIIWCEFDDGAAGSGENRLFQRKLSREGQAEEARAYRRLARLFKAEDGSGWRGLGLEAEAKAMLVRFWEKASPLPGNARVSRQAPFHPRVRAILRWLQDHYREPEVLQGLYAESGMSRNYFRILFAGALQCGPHEYVERLRLRQARYLVHTTDWQLKRIAAEVGYADPLYFSRLYRRFWKRPPSRER
jgi:AraC-like DNA-binding protein